MAQEKPGHLLERQDPSLGAGTRSGVYIQPTCSVGHRIVRIVSDVLHIEGQPAIRRDLWKISELRLQSGSYLLKESVNAMREDIRFRQVPLPHR